MKQQTHFVLLLLLLSNLSCSAQNQKELGKEDIYGNWKCVRLDKRGYQKYTLKQAEKIQASILTLEKNKFYYHNVDFIELCNFYSWKVSSYDTTNLSGNILDITYKKKVLAKIRVLEPVDEKGEFACFNNCALFYLKDDTLINICGGYTLFLLKVKNQNSEQKTPMVGDTVRCKFDEAKCTGFVIQGSRKKGQDVIHVNPVNKEVPKETGELPSMEKPKKKEK